MIWYFIVAATLSFWLGFVFGFKIGNHPQAEDHEMCH